MSKLAVGTFFVALITLISGVGSLAHAGDPIPASPSDVQQLGGVLHWSDNSGNEDGFRIVIRTGPDLGVYDSESQFAVGTNITSFTLPPEASILCPHRTAISIQVTAFNEAGESEPAEHSIVTLCPAPTVESTVGPTAFPETGGHTHRDTRRFWLLSSLLASLSLALLGGGMLRLMRSPT